MIEDILVIGLGTIFGLFAGVVLTMYCFVRNICQRFAQVENKQFFLEKEIQYLKEDMPDKEVQFRQNF